MALLVIAGVLVTLALLLHRALSPPSNFPRNIPTIPIWVSLLGFLTNLDQLEIYAQYIKPSITAHGAVNYFFGGRWNILVQRPELLFEVLKHEDVYAKSGNQKKIPYSVLAAFTGDNVISAHGETWKSYRTVMQPGLQRQDFDFQGIQKNAGKFVGLMLEAQRKLPQGKGVMVNPFIQRFAMQTLGETVLGTDFKTLDSDTPRIHAIHSQLKVQIFKPLFLVAPFLDKFPIESRTKARALVHEFENELVTTVLEQTKDFPEDDDRLISLMKRAKADGTWTEQQFRDNLKITFIAGHENVQQGLNTCLYLLAAHPHLQSALRAEFSSPSPDATTDIANMKASPLLTSFLLETLRLYPPIPQLLNRCTTAAATLGPSNIQIPKDAYVGWTATGAHRDTAAWGADAEEFKPERWGGSTEEMHANMRKWTARGKYVPFHGGRRACLGQGVAMVELRVAVVECVRRSRLSLEDGVTVKFTPGGLLAPMGLRVRFEELEKA
ncbi:putative sporulation-specific N-formyltyrosine oxidase Dit2 [Lophium mytilinum]|uniref:Putative sporulation-specific N-formyltyrosine oxidase Dit2 n=1 Tax=Lophium mytilinum TaxID=390894 RepID=A0A6A6QMS6_9PEZI|nr:putative sporulation-specific N-formyltyrosine oxidase Dit2 [Lophium mytilinum]